MSVNYTINKTDGTILAIVPQETIQVTAGLTLIGKNYIAFGEALNENLVHMAENFANTISPTSPLTGQLWFDKLSNNLKVYNGSGFKSLVTGTFQSTSPSAPVNNELWYDTGSSRLYVYQSGSFRLIGPTNSDPLTNVISDSIADTLGNLHTVLRFQINRTNFAIASNDTFTPAVTQSGFSTNSLIQPGLNLGTDATKLYKFVGTATKSTALDDGSALGLIASNVVRSDTSGTITGALTASLGFATGTSGSLKFQATSGNTLQIINGIANTDLAIQTTDGVSTKNTIYITGNNQRVGINTIAPSSSLHVLGDTTLDGPVTITGTATGVTAATADNTTKLATTAYVKNQLVDTVLTKNLTGPTVATTPPSSSNDQSIPTTGWVKTQLGSLSLGITGITVQKDNTNQGSPAGITTVNFTGPNVSVVGAGGNVDVTIASPANTPSGIITMWYGTAATVPAGWSICDGTLGTPDLRDRFIVGAGNSYATAAASSLSTTSVSTNAGSHNHGGTTGSTAISEAQMPSHTHATATLHSRTVSNGGSASDMLTNVNVGTPVTNLNANTGGGLGHTHTISSDGTHNHTVNVLPPYYALYFIMKL